MKYAKQKLPRRVYVRIRQAGRDSPSCYERLTDEWIKFKRIMRATGCRKNEGVVIWGIVEPLRSRPTEQSRAMLRRAGISL